jgi:hypothetical protein
MVKDGKPVQPIQSLKEIICLGEGHLMMDIVFSLVILFNTISKFILILTKSN